MNFKILVIGEAMVDKYIHGIVDRISPEAPVPVVLFNKNTENLGGSANICQNLANLDADVHLISIVGKDEHEPILTKLCQNNNINLIPIYLNRPTIVKQRIVANNQQIMRVDFENNNNLDSEEEKIVIEQIKKVSKEYDAIILSDYKKGLFTKNIIETIFNHFNNNFILADSKPDKIDLFKRANIIKSNFKEFKDYCKQKNIEVSNDDSSIENTYNKFIYNFNSFLLTRSEKGMSFLSKDKFEHIPTNAKRVYDVTGAGDSVTAAYIIKYLETKKEEISMSFANKVAGIVVSKPGCVAIEKEDLKLKNKNKKIINSYEKIESIVNKLKKDKKKIVFTNGCFDLLHSGHADYLKKAKEMGDILIVGLNSDESIKKIKGENRPIVDQNSRLELISSLESVNYCILFEEDNPINILSYIKPDIHVKGSDYKNKYMIERDMVEINGGQIGFIEIKTNENNKISTSDIIEKIKNEH